MMENWMSWVSYHFKWGAETGWFQRKRCSMRPQTIFFGGERKSKWLIGKYTVHLANTIKQATKQHLQKLDLKFDENGNMLNAGDWRLKREEYLQLMIGSDYFEPCLHGGRAPKIITYKFGFPRDNLNSYGAFDFFIGKGVNCGPGRFSHFGKPPNDDPTSFAYKTWYRDLAKQWRKKDMDYDFDFDIDSHKNPPLVSFSGGEAPIFTGKKHQGTTEAHGRVMSSALFDWSEPEQKLCGVFHCHNAWFPCVVSIQEWTIGDVAGLAYESGQGGNWFGMTPMDKFTAFMMLFVPIFFCVQCCCFCQICSHELKGGVIDEQAVLEERVMQERKRRKGKSRSPRRNRRRSPRRPQHTL